MYQPNRMAKEIWLGSKNFTLHVIHVLFYYYFSFISRRSRRLLLRDTRQILWWFQRHSLRENETTIPIFYRHKNQALELKLGWAGWLYSIWCTRSALPTLRICKFSVVIAIFLFYHLKSESLLCKIQYIYHIFSQSKKGIEMAYTVKTGLHKWFRLSYPKFKCPHSAQTGRGPNSFVRELNGLEAFGRPLASPVLLYKWNSSV